MSWKKTVAFAMVFLVFAVLAILLNRERFFPKQESEPYEISVIIRGKNTESWTTIRQGVDQAARDLNAEVSFIALSNENSAEEQVMLLEREIRNGAQAVVIAPANSDDLRLPVEQAQKKVPVVAMQSTVESMKDLPCVSCDNYALGAAIAKKAAQNGGTAAVLENGGDCSSVRQRRAGVLSVLEKRMKTETWDIPSDSQEACRSVKGILGSGAGKTLIALDGGTLEAAARAVRDLQKEGGARGVRIYGLGRTNESVSLLENEVISAIGVENEFNLGYLSIQAAVDRLNRAPSAPREPVSFTIVDRENMYRSDNQRLLFPFVR